MRQITLNPGDVLEVIAKDRRVAGGLPMIGKVVLPMETTKTKPWYEATRRFGPYNHHPDRCEDYNLETGGDTDLGERLVAPFGGIVLARTDLGGAIGKVIQILGITEEETAYVWAGWHLDELADWYTGNIIQAGDYIGTIGTAGGRYAAHLHTQICYITRDSGIPAPWTFPSNARYKWISPSKWFVEAGGIDRHLMRQVTEFDGKPQEPPPGPIAQCLGIIE
jgi:hypothetical protein